MKRLLLICIVLLAPSPTVFLLPENARENGIDGPFITEDGGSVTADTALIDEKKRPNADNPEHPNVEMQQPRWDDGWYDKKKQMEERKKRKKLNRYV
jgi:hypothetical protein